MNRIIQWLISWVLWIVTLGRLIRQPNGNPQILPQQIPQQQLTNSSTNNNSNLQNRNNNNIQINNNTTNNNNTNEKNVFKNIDQKPTVSYTDYKKSIKEYLKDTFDEIDEDSIYSFIIQNLTLDDSNQQLPLDVILHRQFESMSSILQLIKNPKLQFSIINTIIEHFKNTYNIKTKQGLMGFYAVLVGCSIRSDKEKQEIKDVILNLPPSVLGDISNRNTSRVLVDLNLDVNESISTDRLKMEPFKSFVYDISNVLLDYITNHKTINQWSTNQTSDSNNSQSTSENNPILLKSELVGYLLLNLKSSFKSKLLFQHLIFNRLLQSSNESRVTIIDFLFSYQPKIKLDLIDSNSIKKPTTTTTTTTTTTKTF